MIYIYDDTFEGLLTTIFYAYEDIRIVSSIRPDEGQLDFLEPRFHVASENDKVDRIVAYVFKKFGRQFLKDIFYVYCSTAPEKELAILHTLYLGRRMGRSVLNLMEDPVLRFVAAHKKVGRELHRYEGLLRFTELADGSLYAPFTPEADLLPLIFSHFQNRLSSERFIIHDRNRRYAILYDGHVAQNISLDQVRPELWSKEDDYRKLWKTFYDAIEIRGRHNPKLRQNNMPKKYWRELIELII